MMPTGVAFAPDGDLIVTDAAAQRIRAISRNGSVTTIAGSGDHRGAGLFLLGGYRDGPASVAQFDHPTGVAVDSSGNIYVADTFNHCIRKIDKSGNVTTYAGSNEAGTTDGVRSAARFVQPLGLAVDAAGNVYVADPYSGLRKISASGMVTTIDRATSADNYAMCVAVYNAEEGPVIFVGERFGVLAIASNGEKERFAGARDADMLPEPAGLPANLRRLTEARKALGSPAGITALSDHTVAYVDPRTNMVRVLELLYGTVRVVGGQPIDDVSGDNAGFRDGPAASSLFNVPLGIASDAGGRLYVTDGGNRRVRDISGLDYRYAATPAHGLLDPQLQAPSSAYRIAYAGNSAIWYNTDWKSSIEGGLEDNLNGAANGARRFRVIPVRGISTFESGADYAGFLARTGAVNLVLLNINAGNMVPLLGDLTQEESALNQSDWAPKLTTGLRNLQEQLARQGVAFCVVTYPVAFDPAEGAYAGMLAPIKWASTSLSLEAQLSAAIRASNVPVIDLRPGFMAYEARPDHAALFGGDEFHLSKEGRLLLAQLVSKELQRLAPWKRP